MVLLGFGGRREGADHQHARTTGHVTEASCRRGGNIQRAIAALRSRINSAHRPDDFVTPMKTDPEEEEFVQTFRRYFARIQSRDGDERLRQRLLASRAVMSFDAQAGDEDKRAWLDALDLIEAKLLPGSSAERPST